MSGEPPSDPAAPLAALGQELRIQRALVAIGDAANRADDLAAFYPIVHGTDAPRGGHFGPWEQPEFWARDLTAFFDAL